MMIKQNQHKILPDFVRPELAYIVEITGIDKVHSHRGQILYPLPDFPAGLFITISVHSLKPREIHPQMRFLPVKILLFINMGKIHHHHRRSCLLPFLFPIPHFHSRPAHTSLPGRTYIRLSGKGILPVENFHVHRIILFRHNGGAYCVPCNVHRSPRHIQDPVNPHNQPDCLNRQPYRIENHG